MSQIYKIALLEDNKKQLEKLEFYLKKIPNLDLVIKSQNSDDFFEQLKTAIPNLLITDLDLGVDSMSGIEIAQELKLPVFFQSINTSEYIENIEHLKREAEICIDHITKPYTEEQFLKSFKRFLKEVELFSNLKYVYLNFNKYNRNKVFIDDIVYLCADKNAGSESNNKQIYFINKKSENLVDFSFSKMQEKGLYPDQFLTIHKSFRVNKKHIQKYCYKTNTIEIKIYHDENFVKTVKLSVSENYQNVIKKNLS